jgi:uncharacterized membrane protein
MKKLFLKLINLAIAIVNILLVLMELLTHKWVLIALLVSILLNFGLITAGVVKLIRRFSASKRVKNKEQEENNNG